MQRFGISIGHIIGFIILASWVYSICVWQIEWGLFTTAFFLWMTISAFGGVMAGCSVLIFEIIAIALILYDVYYSK